jgi:hypothetical protein
MTSSFPMPIDRATSGPKHVRRDHPGTKRARRDHEHGREENDVLEHVLSLQGRLIEPPAEQFIGEQDQRGEDPDHRDDE